jgi:hypothetical protein
MPRTPGACRECDGPSGERVKAVEAADIAEDSRDDQPCDPDPGHAGHHARMKPAAGQHLPAAELEPAELIFVVADKHKRRACGARRAVHIEHAARKAAATSSADAALCLPAHGFSRTVIG